MPRNNKVPGTEPEEMDEDAVEEENFELNEEVDEKTSLIKDLTFALPITVAFTLIYAFLFNQFKQIPGPMYGGDYYFHYGIINHIFNGNLPWTCPQVQGEYQFYGWLLHFLVAVIGKITGDLLKSYTLYFPILVMLGSGILVYFLGKEVFKNAKFAALLTLAWMGTRLYIDYIPSNFTPTLMTPLFLLTTLKAYKERSLKWVIVAGISFGLFILSHASSLPVGAFFIFMLFIYDAFNGRLNFGFNSETMQWNFSAKEGAQLKKSVTSSIKLLLPIFIIGFLIGLLYWGPVLFIYHFKTKNPWTDFTQPDYAAYGVTIAVEKLTFYLFNITTLSNTSILSINYFILSVLTTIGIYAAAFKQKRKESTFLLIAFLSGFIGLFHYFITIPLLGTHYAPERFENFLINPVSFILAIYGIYFLYNLLRRDDNRKILLGLFVVYFLLVAQQKYTASEADKWTQLGKQPMDGAYNELSEWVKANTDKNAVFISHDETSFALNGLTGRKVVWERRTHFNPYIDINERIADGAVILYGNSSAKTLELLKKYNITYLYWDANYMYFAANEPTMTWPKYADYLKQYGIKTVAMHTYIDPAWNERNIKYDIIAIVPARNDPLQPWSDELHKHLKLQKEIIVQNTPGFRVYSIDYSSF